MTTQFKMPETAEEIAHAINEAIGTHGYYPYYHYDRQVGMWALISMDKAHARGDNPVEVSIAIRPGVEIDFQTIKELVDDYRWVVTNELGTHEGVFTFTYEYRMPQLTTIVTTYPPNTQGDISSTYKVEKKPA